MNRHATPIAAVLLAALLAVVVGCGVLRSGGDLLSAYRADLSQVYVGWRAFAARWIARGVFPAWNPHHFCGTPFAANPESALFYPPNLVYLVLPLPMALNASILGHLLLAGVLTWGCARRLGLSAPPALLAGLSYMMASQNFGRLQAGHLSNLCSFPWLPLALLATERTSQQSHTRSIALGGVALALMLLAGNLQYTYFGAIFLALYAIPRLLGAFTLRAPLRLAGMGLLAAGLAAVQLTLTLKNLPESSRHVLPPQYAGGYSLPPAHLVNFLIPGLFGPGPLVPYWGKGFEWEYGAYIGILPLALALLAIYWTLRTPATLPQGQVVVARALLFAGAACLILSLGRYTPVFGPLSSIIPGFALLRGFAKFLVPVSLSGALLAAFGLEWAIRLARSERARVIGPAAAVTLLVMASIISVHVYVIHRMDFATWLKSATQPPEPNPFAALMHEIVWPSMRLQAVFAAITVLFFLSLGLSALLLATRFPRFQFPFMALLLAAASLDLGLAGLWTAGAFPSRLLAPPPDLAGQRGLEAHEARVQLVRPADRESTAELADVLTPAGSEALYPDRLLRLFNALNGKAYDAGTFNLSEDVPPRAGPVLGVRYSLTPKQSNYFPEGARLHLFHSGTFLSTEQEIWQRLSAPSWDFASDLLLHDPTGETPTGSFHYPSDPHATARILGETPNQLDVSVQSATPSILFVSDIHASGWSATVDGNATPILHADFAFRALRIPAGQHAVRFRYSPPGLTLGACISAISLVICLGLWRRSR